MQDYVVELLDVVDRATPRLLGLSEEESARRHHVSQILGAEWSR